MQGLWGFEGLGHAREPQFVKRGVVVAGGLQTFGGVSAQQPHEPEAAAVALFGVGSAALEERWPVQILKPAPAAAFGLLERPLVQRRETAAGWPCGVRRGTRKSGCVAAP